MFCGRGLLSCIIDTRELERDADKAAARTLEKDGLPGKQIMRSLIWRLDALNAGQNHNSQVTYQPGESLSVSRIIKEVLYGDVNFWYEHPSIDDRIKVLAEGTTA